MSKDRLSDEVSEIADRLSVSARSWSRPDAPTHRDPAAELTLTLDTMNELNARRLRIAELEAALRAIYEAADSSCDDQDWADRVSAAMTDERRNLVTE